MFIIFNMSSLENLTEHTELTIFFIISDGKELSLFIKEHSFAKKKKKKFSFSSKTSHE